MGNYIYQEETEVWRCVAGFTDYMVSDKGNIKSTKKSSDIILKPKKTKVGYLQVCLWNCGKRKAFSIHRLVAQAFVENHDSKKEVNHINGDKLDNTAINLEWCSSSDNKKHAWSLGLYENSRAVSKEYGKKFKGSNHWMAKLDNDHIADEIREIYKCGGVTQVELGKKFGISGSQVSNIVNNKCHRH